MINGLGVLGWGVGGIEAEAAMLGQPISMLLPQVIGFKLTGELPEGATATDLVLTVTEMLREHGVVGKFVEFFGPGISRPRARRPGDDRQHVAGVRLDLRDLPGRRRDAALPRVHRSADRADRAGRRLHARAGAVPRRPTPRSRPTATRSSSTSASVEPSIAGPEAPPGPDPALRRQAGVLRVAAASSTPTPRRSSAASSTRRSPSASRPRTRPAEDHEDDAGEAAPRGRGRGHRDRRADQRRGRGRARGRRARSSSTTAAS